MQSIYSCIVFFFLWTRGTLPSVGLVGGCLRHTVASPLGTPCPPCFFFWCVDDAWVMQQRRRPGQVRVLRCALMPLVTMLVSLLVSLYFPFSLPCVSALMVPLGDWCGAHAAGLGHDEEGAGQVPPLRGLACSLVRAGRLSFASVVVSFLNEKSCCGAVVTVFPSLAHFLSFARTLVPCARTSNSVLALTYADESITLGREWSRPYGACNNSDRECNSIQLRFEMVRTSTSCSRPAATHVGKNVRIHGSQRSPLPNQWRYGTVATALVASTSSATARAPS